MYRAGALRTPDGDGRYRDLLVGVALGFLGGFLVVFLASDQAFSQRYVVGTNVFGAPDRIVVVRSSAAGPGARWPGIFTGMLINLAFGFLRMTYY